MANGIDLRFKRSAPMGEMSLSFENDILSLLNNKGDVLSSVNIDLIKKEELPTANEDNLGVIYLYTGPDGEYKHGYFYECVENSGIYSWENIIVQDSYLKSETYSKTESDDSFVHKTGDETISDIKTFIGKSAQDPLEAHMIIKNLKDDFRYSNGTKFYYTSFRDKNNKECGWMGYNHTDKSSFIELGARKTPLGNLVTTLEVGFDDDGNAYTYAPKPTEDTTTSRQLDTVGARNTKLQNYQEKETAINYNNISNCITEIPQDIKLELNNGVLTLKAGSKVYTPNGIGTFSSTTITTDKVCSTSTSAGTRLIFISGNSFFSILTQYAYSGNTAQMNSTTAYTYARFYNTETNKMYIGDSNGGNWVETSVSLPLAVVTNDSSGNFTAIDQIFNGFGYIGSTVFALPGVKGLIPNGRNEDGSLKSVEVTISDVKTFFYNATGNHFIIIDKQGDIFYRGDASYYDEKENLLNDYGQMVANCVIGRCYLTSGVISNFKIKTPFHAVDYNDKSTISGWAMPSDRYINLTLGASGTTYTAPADGYFSISLRTTSTSTGFIIMNTDISRNFIGSSASIRDFNATECRTFIPVKKGEIMHLYYAGSITSASTVVTFRFIYAEGSK